MEKESIPYESVVKINEKQFVPHRLAIKLKELGFDDVCLAHFNDSRELKYNAEPVWLCRPLFINAPLWQQAFDWFREQHSLFGAAQYDHIKNALSYYIVWGRMGGYCNVEWDYLTYQEARQACLEKLIEAVTPKE